MYLAEGLTALAMLAVPAHHAPTVIVQAGQTLSGIAAGHCPTASDYPGLAAASGIANPDDITPGQPVTIACSTIGPRSRWKPVLAATTTTWTGRRSRGRHARGSDPPRDQFDGHHGQCGDGDGDGMDADCSVIFPQRHGGTTYTGRHRAGAAVTAGARVSPSAYSGFQACVIARESGGNSQVMNSSGHYGLYQFSASTWQAYGGPAADFGHASVAEQNQVFNTAMAQGGQSNWSPYDGC